MILLLIWLYILDSLLPPHKKYVTMYVYTIIMLQAKCYYTYVRTYMYIRICHGWNQQQVQNFKKTRRLFQLNKKVWLPHKVIMWQHKDAKRWPKLNTGVLISARVYNTTTNRLLYISLFPLTSKHTSTVRYIHIMSPNFMVVMFTFVLDLPAPLTAVTVMS